MASIRRNITNQADRERYAAACVALDSSFPGVSAVQAVNFTAGVAPNLQWAGTDQQLSYYDLFVLWHVTAMSIMTSQGGNRAHGGPVFLPWHRHYMILLERWMQSACE